MWDYAKLAEKFGHDLVFMPEERYLEERRGRLKGQALALLKPRDVREVSQIISFASEESLPVVPYGGGTGLVGGQVKPDAPFPLIISLERMQAVRALDKTGNILVIEAGATLKEAQDAASSAYRLYPLSLASEGSATIGGTLATNAGGVQVLRYGNARDLCLGVEAVLPDGAIFNDLKGLRKDNTGYKLSQLLIGSEGSLGIITAASLKLFARPDESVTGVLSVKSPALAISVFEAMHERLGDVLTAFELISKMGLDFLKEVYGFEHLPYPDGSDWYVLFECGSFKGSGLEDAVMHLFAKLIDQALVTDGVVASSLKQRDDLWRIRETIPEANARIGAIASHDVSLPIPRIPDFIEEGRKRVETLLPALRLNCFGHLGDGNLHFNFFPPKGKHKSEYKAQAGALSRIVHDLVYEMGGSISAEHGIGRFKSEELNLYEEKTKLAVMKTLKKALDPKGIMNPGAVIAHSAQS